MPHHRVEVVDLGLVPEEALEQGLATEQFVRRKELPWQLRRRLTPLQKEWFGGTYRGHSAWECTRCELNAFTGPELVAFVEEKLAEHDADQKLIPPDEVMAKQARGDAAEQLRQQVEATLDLDLDSRRCVFGDVGADLRERILSLLDAVDTYAGDIGLIPLPDEVTRALGEDVGPGGDPRPRCRRRGRGGHRATRSATRRSSAWSAR